jgi:hypothetical protein
MVKVICDSNSMNGKVQSITTICFISYERKPIAKFLQFTTTCFSLIGHHQVVSLPVKEESLHNMGDASYW